MKDVLLVGLGGFIGSVARFKIGGLVLHLWGNARFPVSTFAVNVAGCLTIGVLAGLAVRHDLLSDNLRLLLFSGFLGGFTTFSAFGLDALTLVQRGDWLLGCIYVCATVFLGLAAIWLGYACSFI